MAKLSALDRVVVFICREGWNILRVPSTENTWKENWRTKAGGCHWTREWGSAECYSRATVSTSEESDDSPRMVQLLEHFSLQAAYSWEITEIPRALLALRFYLVASLPAYKFSKREHVKCIFKSMIRACTKKTG